MEYTTPTLYRQTPFGRMMEDSVKELLLDDGDADTIRTIYDQVVFDKLLKRVDNKVTFTATKKSLQDINENTCSFTLCNVKFDDGRNIIEVPKLRITAYTDGNHPMSGMRAKKSKEKKRMIINSTPDMPSDLTELYRVMMNSILSQVKRILTHDSDEQEDEVKERLMQLKKLWESKIEESEMTAPIYWKTDSDTFPLTPFQASPPPTLIHDDLIGPWDDEEELNSDDDQSVDDEPIATDNILVCCLKPLRRMKQHPQQLQLQIKPTKSQLKTKWKSKKFRFTEGIMHVNKRDYTFKVANVSILE